MEPPLKRAKLSFTGKSRYLPTSDVDVMRILRQYNQPIVLFDENPVARRQRLDQYLRESGRLTEATKEDFFQHKAIAPSFEQTDQTEEDLFYTQAENPESLIACRMKIWEFSKQQCTQRLTKLNEKIKSLDDDTVSVLSKEISEKLILVNGWKSLNLQASHIVHSRIVSSVDCFAGRVATGSWDGSIKLFSCDKGSELNVIQEFTSPPEWKVTDVAFRKAGVSGNILVSGDTEGSVSIWKDSKKECMVRLAKHRQRCARLRFHPLGDYFASTSYDNDWILWDLEKQIGLFEQEGHCHPIYDVAFHPDGSLAGTCDLGGIIRLWDLRTGQSIVTFKNTSGPLYSLDFSPNGYQLASAGGDNFIKIWDLRRGKLFYSIPAHQKLISCVRYEQGNGRFLISSSYDRTIRLWSCGNWRLIKSLKGHERCVTKIAQLDEKPTFFSSSFDKTVKVWGHDVIDESLLSLLNL